MKRSKFHTFRIPDLQHFKFSPDQSEAIEIKNIPLHLLMFNMEKNIPRGIIQIASWQENKKNNIITKLFNNQFVFP